MESTSKTTSKSKGRRTLILAVALLLAAGATGAYFYRQRNGDKPATATTTDEETADEVSSLDTQYKLTQDQLDGTNLTNAQKARLYGVAAFQAAQLDKESEAKDYATKALELYGADTTTDKTTAEYKALISILTQVKDGNIDAAKPGTETE